jgi:hypothetical protein
MESRNGRKAALAGMTAFAAWKLSRRLREADFGGKTALVTGGSRGLGFLIARELLGRAAESRSAPGTERSSHGPPARFVPVRAPCFPFPATSRTGTRLTT